MKRLLTSVLLTFTLAAPVAAHHVPTGEPVTDSDALAIYVVEALDQSKALYVTHQRYGAATDTLEKSAIQVEMRAGITATIEHIGSLDTRACFSELSTLFDDYFTAIANAYGEDVTPDQRAGFLAQVGVLSGLINGNILKSLGECAPSV